MSQTIEQIAARIPGYDPQDLHADQVQDFLARLVPGPTQSEEVGIFDALGRVLAQDLVCPRDVPPHDNAAMDGYAFDGSALSGGMPLRLRVVGTALAGLPWTGHVGAGEAVRIMTGAVMPPGVDTVAPIELVQQEPGDAVLVPARLARGANRRLRGEDLRHGAAALRRGDLLGPAGLGLIASLGLARVPVWRALKVATFSTGDELLSLGQAPRAGAIYDSNRYTMFGLLRRLGAQVIDMGAVPDDPVALEAAFLQAARQADAIITSGGVSAGDADHTRAMMHKLSAGSGGVAFWRIAMRPGRPMAVGRITAGIRDAVLFGLPGNPVAVMVSFLAFVRPALLRMMGCNSTDPPLLRARCTQSIAKKPGRTEFQRGWVGRSDDGTVQVTPTASQGSGVLSSMVQANCLIVLAHDRGDLCAGEELDVMMFEGVM